MASSDYLTDRITSLKAKLKARDKQTHFKQNCEDLRKEISRLGALQGE